MSDESYAPQAFLYLPYYIAADFVDVGVAPEGASALGLSTICKLASAALWCQFSCWSGKWMPKRVRIGANMRVSCARSLVSAHVSLFMNYLFLTEARLPST